MLFNRLDFCEFEIVGVTSGKGDFLSLIEVDLFDRVVFSHYVSAPITLNPFSVHFQVATANGAS